MYTVEGYLTLPVLTRDHNAVKGLSNFETKVGLVMVKYFIEIKKRCYQNKN